MTTDYSAWESRDAALVTELFLDPNNPRIAVEGQTSRAPADLLADLVEHENVEKIAASIASRGYFPNEILIAVEEHIGGRKGLCVVEGNRRLAAMKALMNPDVLPEKYLAKFRKLAKEAKLAADATVPILIAPSRNEAMPLIVARHTHAEIKRWGVAAQGRYFFSMRERGYSVADISETSGLAEAEVLKSVRAYRLYRAACSVPLDEDTSTRVLDSRKFPISTLERVFQSRTMLDAFKADFIDENLRVRVSKPVWTKGFSRIVSDLAHGRKTSRSLDTAEHFKKYLKDMGADRPRGSGSRAFTVDSGGGPKAKPKPTKTSAPKKRATRTPKNVIPSDFNPRLFGPRVKSVYGELRKLRLEDHPNASALLLRTLVDLCVTETIAMTGQTEAFEAPHRQPKRKGGARPDHWS